MTNAIALPLQRGSLAKHWTLARLDIQAHPYGLGHNGPEGIDLSSRRAEIAGAASQANGLWMTQVTRNLNDAAEGFLTGKRYLIHDRDPLFTAEFLQTPEASGVESVKLPPCSPNVNAYAERFVRTINESCLERMILFGEGSLRKGHPGICGRITITSETTKAWAIA